MQFKILGPTRLTIANRLIDLGPAKQRGLLALLLYHVNSPVSVEAIGNHLWPGRPVAAVQRSLYEQVSRIRKVFKENSVPAELPRTGTAYRLDTDPELIDYKLFLARLQTAQSAAAKGDHEAVVMALSDAVEWWTGPPLEGLKSADAEHTRELMVTMWGLLPAYHLLFDSQLELGQHHAVLSRLSPLRDKYPYDEVLAKQWLLALGATGGRPDHLTKQYNRLRQQLDDTGNEPLHELRAAYQRVLGVSRPDPPVDFVPPRQLLRAPREFIGHGALIAELDAMLDEPGVPAGIALTGMGGIGKTTLATHWAHRRRDRFPDGQLYVNANGFGPGQPVSPDDILARFLHALGVPVDRIPSAGERRRARLAHLVADRRVLVILDNVRNADQVRPLLPALSACTVLITSRDRLRELTIRDGVRSIVVPTLSTSESTTLLSNLIGATRAAEDPETVVTLANLSDGLPLFLQIAGQHIAERPQALLPDLLDQLRDLLSSVPDDDTNEEETSLHGVFAWSYEELPASTARMFRLLGLHPSRSFSAQVATALSGEDAERHLTTLIRMHLLEHDIAGHVRAHDLLHRYMLVRCELDDPAPERMAAIRRMLDFYLLSATNAARVLFPQSPTVPDLPLSTSATMKTFDTHAAARRWCELERTNILSAAEYAATQGFYNHAWQIPGAAMDALIHYGQQGTSDLIKSCEVSLASARRSGNAEGTFGSQSNLGVLLFRIGENKVAVGHLQEAVDLARQSGHRTAEPVLLHNLACALLRLGKVRDSIRLFKQARAINQKFGNIANEAHNLHRLGSAHHRIERNDIAVDYYQQALAMRQDIGDLQGQGQTHAELGQLMYELKDVESAREHSSKALEIHHEVPDRPMMAFTLITLASVHLKRFEFTGAVERSTQAAHICAEIVDFPLRARALAVLGAALQALGDFPAAKMAWLEELGIRDSRNDPDAATTRERLAALDRADKTPAQRRPADTQQSRSQPEI